MLSLRKKVEFLPSFLRAFIVPLLIFHQCLVTLQCGVPFSSCSHLLPNCIHCRLCVDGYHIFICSSTTPEPLNHLHLSTHLSIGISSGDLLSGTHKRTWIVSNPPNLFFLLSALSQKCPQRLSCSSRKLGCHP